jgi:hypothetical protein
MDVVEIFGRTVNKASKEGIEKALVFLQLPIERIEDQIKKKKYLVSYKGFDIVIDYKPKLNQVNLYLTTNKWSKKLLNSLKKSSDFKSMTILLGSIKILQKSFELRLGAFGIPSSELTKAIIKFKK